MSISKACSAYPLASLKTVIAFSPFNKKCPYIDKVFARNMYDSIKEFSEAISTASIYLPSSKRIFDLFIIFSSE